MQLGSNSQIHAIAGREMICNLGYLFLQHFLLRRYYLTVQLTEDGWDRIKEQDSISTSVPLFATILFTARRPKLTTVTTAVCYKLFAED